MPEPERSRVKPRDYHHRHHHHHHHHHQPSTPTRLHRRPHTTLPSLDYAREDADLVLGLIVNTIGVLEMDGPGHPMDQGTLWTRAPYGPGHPMDQGTLWTRAPYGPGHPMDQGTLWTRAPYGPGHPMDQGTLLPIASAHLLTMAAEHAEVNLNSVHRKC